MIRSHDRKRLYKDVSALRRTLDILPHSSTARVEIAELIRTIEKKIHLHSGTGLTRRLKQVTFNARTRPLHLAACRGDIRALQCLLSKNRASVNTVDSDGRTALMAAISMNQVDVCSVLIEFGCDLEIADTMGYTALMLCAALGQLEIIRVLTRHGALLHCKDNGKRTALHWASKETNGDSACLQHLLEVAQTREKDAILGGIAISADECLQTLVNCKDTENLSPLHWAVVSGGKNAVSALLQNSCSTLVTDDEGRTPLHYAVSADAIPCVSMLLAHAPEDVNIGDRYGRTVLHTLCMEGTIEVAMVLFSCREIDIDAVDARGATPLHWAAVCNRPELCSLFLNQGANALAIDSTRRQTPLQYAQQRGLTACAQVLQQAVRHQESCGGDSEAASTAVPPPQYEPPAELSSTNRRQINERGESRILVSFASRSARLQRRPPSEVPLAAMPPPYSSVAAYPTPPLATSP